MTGVLRASDHPRTRLVEGEEVDTIEECNDEDKIDGHLGRFCSNAKVYAHMMHCRQLVSACPWSVVEIGSTPPTWALEDQLSELGICFHQELR